MRFLGNGFNLTVPAGWVDLTIYQFFSSVDDPEEPSIRGVVEPNPETQSVDSFAGGQVGAILETAGTSLLCQDEISLGASKAVRAEICWHPCEDKKLYLRQLCSLIDGGGVTLSTQLTKKQRSTVGPLLDQIMESFSPRGSDKLPEPPQGFVCLAAHGFYLLAPDNWVDQTEYLFCEPDDSQFRRNIMIQQRPLEEEMTLSDIASEVITSLQETIEGIENLEQADTRLADGRPVVRVTFLNPTESGSSVRQTQVLALRGDRLYTLGVTAEPDPPQDIQTTLENALGSFSLDREEAPQASTET